jgi:hypothetical protein
MQNYNYEEIVELVKLLLERNTPHSSIRKIIGDKAGLKKSARNNLFQKIIGELTGSKEFKGAEKSELKASKPSDKYFYNSLDDNYVFPSKAIGRNIVLPGEEINYLIKAYSSFLGNEASIEEISLKFNIPKAAVKEIISALGITHDSLPISSENLATKSEDELVNDLIQEKRFSIFQKWQKLDWANSLKNAEKWVSFEMGQLNPLKEFFETWTGPKNKFSPIPIKKSDGKYVLICSLSDSHVGELAKAKDLFHGKDYNVEIAGKLIDGYCNKVCDILREREGKFKSTILYINGDFLHSTFNGFTSRGTQLHSDMINTEMFEAGLNILINFVGKLRQVIGSVKVIINDGNHDFCISSLMGIAASAYFKDDGGTIFSMSKTWAHIERINNVLLLSTHGASGEYKHSVPKDGSSLESYVQRMFLAKTDEYKGVSQRVCLIGHRHSFKQEDMNGIEFIVMGSPVLGDKFSDSGNWRSRARFNSLVIGENSVEETLHHLI